MKIEPYDIVKLKSGHAGAVLAVSENGDSYMVEVGKDALKQGFPYELIDADGLYGYSVSVTLKDMAEIIIDKQTAIKVTA